MLQQMRIEQILKNLQELDELLRLIGKSSPEVPDILYRLAVEKAECVTEKVKELPLDRRDKPVNEAFSIEENVCVEEDNIPEEAEANDSDPVREDDPVRVIPEPEPVPSPAPESRQTVTAEADTEQSEPEMVIIEEETVSKTVTVKTTVADKVAHSDIKDIRKMISLNDRFRFRRELFVNSDDTMNAALDALREMPSYGEAEIYLLDQFGWDLETNETAVEFMEVVAKRFN